MRRTVALAAAMCAAVAALSAQRPILVRETRAVSVAGHQESWALRWITPPQPACTGDMAGTCPCSGFADGEHGQLELVREGAGPRAERLPLTPLFEELYSDWLTSWGPTAVVQRRDDSGRSVDVMTLRDYDRDGGATEFFLQTVSRPCGKRMGVVVGVSQREPTLHAFTSAAHPERPLVLRIDQWQALAQHDTATTIVDWACGDHAADEEEEVTLSAGGGVIHVTRAFYACGANSTRGPLLRREPQ